MQVQKDGRTWRRYTRPEPAIIEEELNKLIQAGYQCFETRNEDTPAQACQSPPTVSGTNKPNAL